VCAKSEIRSEDASKVSEIAGYLKDNPSILVGLDGANVWHVDAVRSALIKAGVAESRIKTGSFGDANLRNDQRVEVLLISSN